jgi:hypothetical protein
MVALAISAASTLLAPSLARAAEPAAPKESKTVQPEEEDFAGSPFTEYGEFNEEREEEEDAKFFAHGRFFGASLGAGYEGVTGNRGLLYQGGFPTIDFKLHYWFDFHFALDINLYYASHFFETTTTNGGHTDVNVFHVGTDVKYYFDTKNLSAPISFANPYLILGFGSYTQTKSSFTQATQDPDTGVGLTGGAGLEFAIRPKKAYLELEAKYHLVRFKDSGTDQFRTSNNVPDLSGGFFTVIASVLFTW